MTEPEWKACDDPAKMVSWLTGRASERKLRLLACACFRTWGAAVPCGEAACAAVELAERYADGEVAFDELMKVWNAVSADYYGVFLHPGPGVAEARRSDRRPWLMARMATLAASLRKGGVARGAEATADPEMWHVLAGTAKNERLLDHLRCIFGNPFRPLTISPVALAWNGGTLGRMAKAIYDGRRWDDMPLLGDALEEAGLDDAGVLEHCRGTGPHALGCHVVDVLLRKS